MPIETGHRIQLAAEWVAELGLEENAVLERTAEGILVGPCRPTWNGIFLGKLEMGQQPSALDLSEVSADDLLL